MARILISLIAGALFGGGLIVSDMVNPARVLAFLDIFGDWDPTLAFVMGGAIVPSALAYAFSKKLSRPLIEERFFVPANRTIDLKLVTGALIFGAGWGLVGYCPGPAIAGLVFGDWQPFVFVASMLAGMWLYRMSSAFLDSKRSFA
ncbi:MAG: YeeE/YedE family protein [Erythrobacter sp.]|uniref:DUF6691 family protein n=1 Tax=Erythrobacter sp. TaxID=1042 RepID=UPI00261C767E|nr:DUF6691 family protein [Erythrobacter sp.]MDJ0977590.1 YeeE/YedE family protein [Erythrobacter sp.]